MFPDNDFVSPSFDPNSSSEASSSDALFELDGSFDSETLEDSSPESNSTLFEDVVFDMDNDDDSENVRESIGVWEGGQWEDSGDSYLPDTLAFWNPWWQRESK